MSKINFHCQTEGVGDIQVHGSERAHFGILTEEFAKGAVGLVRDYRSRSKLRESFEPFINPEGALNDSTAENFDAILGYSLVTMGFSDKPPVFAWKGRPIATRALLINTVLAAGSDPLRLAMRIHYTCETYGYVQGFHRGWMADVIEEGLAENVYYRGFWDYQDPEAQLKTIIGIDVPEEGRKPVFRSFGWDALIGMLRSGSKGAVVMSSSGGESFPNPSVGIWMPPWPEGIAKDWTLLTEEQQTERERRQEAWENLSDKKQWEISLRGLKEREQPAITPQNLRTYRFRHEISLLDLLHQDVERVEKGLGIA